MLLEWTNVVCTQRWLEEIDGVEMENKIIRLSFSFVVA